MFTLLVSHLITSSCLFLRLLDSLPSFRSSYTSLDPGFDLFVKIFPMMIIYNITNNILTTGNAHLKFEASVSLFLKGVDQLSCLEQPILFLKTNLNPPSPLGKPPVKRSSVVVTKCLPDLVQVLGRDDTKGPHCTGALNIFNWRISFFWTCSWLPSQTCLL